MISSTTVARRSASAARRSVRVLSARIRQISERQRSALASCALATWQAPRSRGVHEGERLVERAVDCAVENARRHRVLDLHLAECPPFATGGQRDGPIRERTEHPLGPVIGDDGEAADVFSLQDAGGVKQLVERLARSHRSRHDVFHLHRAFGLPW
jgi:hypothetical protein